MVACSATSVESCLCLKVPREFPRAKPPQWVEKATKYRWFYTFQAAKNWKKFQSGIWYKYASYSGVKLESRQTALYEAAILHLVVQNAGNPGVKEGKTSVNWSFYAPKKRFYGCDGSSWVYVWLHREGMYRDCGDFHIAVSGCPVRLRWYSDIELIDSNARKFASCTCFISRGGMIWELEMKSLQHLH